MKQKILTVCIAFLGIAFFFHARPADAASLSFSPEGGTYSAGQTFSVDVFVSAASQAVNAFSGDITYSSGTLRALSVSKAGSIVNFWTANPSIAKGVIHYEGITLNPGYTGAHGKIVTLTFKALFAGTATLKFSSASVLANDGLGTSVISGTGFASYVIKPAVSEPVSSALPPAPEITSATHPDEAMWYSGRVAELAWNVPPDVTAVAYLTNENPVGNPRFSRGLSKGVSTASLSDGIWYTHVRFQNASGWGPTTTYKTQIDGTPPSNFVVKEDSSSDMPVKTVSLSATDALSGISGFGVSIDGGSEVFVPVAMPITQYSSENLPQGDHTLLVKAYDKAGNTALYNSIFSTKRLDPPVITDYQKELRDQDFLVMHGTTYPNMKVSFSLTREIPIEQGIFGKHMYVTDGTPLSGTAVSDSSGNFVFAYPDRLSYGLYQITARAVLSDGTKSDSSPLITIPVIESLFMRIVRILISPTILACIAFFGIGFCIFLLARTHKKYRTLQREAEQLKHHTIDNITD
jgi:hypothetical protein